jgi:hypothetical protein
MFACIHSLHELRIWSGTLRDASIAKIEPLAPGEHAPHPEGGAPTATGALPRHHLIATGGRVLPRAIPPVVLIALPALLVATLSCGERSPRIDPPRPEVSGTDPVAEPTLPPSRLDVPVTVDLSPVLEDLEADVPVTFGNIEDRRDIPGNDRLDVAWEAERSPFQAELEGDTARLTALIRYRARAWYNPPIAPELSASCGTDGDTDNRPTALVAVSTRLDIDRDWVLRSELGVDEVRPASDAPENECRITALRIDVTNDVMRAARDLLEEEAPSIDSILATIDMRSMFREWWDLLRTPILLTDSIWLLIDPIAIRKGAIDGTRHTLQAEIGLTATPRIVIGRTPSRPEQPLPPLEAGIVDPGLHILVEGLIEYPVISQFLNQEFAGRTFEQSGHSLQVASLTLSGIGNGRLALRVDFSGDVTGHVYFIGAPVYDPISGLVSVPDLDFDVATSSLLVESLDWLRHGDFVEWVRDRARWPVDDAIAEGRRLLMEGLNRDLSSTVRLSGEVESVVPLAVLPTARALRVQAHARASARLVVR